MKHLVSRRHLLSGCSEAELDLGSGDKPDRSSFSQQEKDLLKDEQTVTILSVVMSTVSFFSYTMDVMSSAVVCYLLYGTGRWWWWLSISSLLLALLLVNVFSLRWYIHDAQEQKDHLPPTTASHWVLRVMFHVTFLGPLIRYTELLLYGIHAIDKKDPNQQQYTLMFLQEDRDSSLLTLVGSFVKSAPQLVLQMYILTQNHIPIDQPTTRAQAVSLVSSVVELSLAQCSYHRALRRSTPYKRNMSRMGALFQFLSHCGVIASRILSLAVFASEYHYLIFVFSSIHWALMTVWLIVQRTDTCSTATGQPRPLEELIFNFVIGLIYLFCFVNVKDEPTRWKYTSYYFLIWIENVTLTTLWFVKANPDLWFRIPLLASVIISLAAGLTLLGVYYQYLHPNKEWLKYHLKKRLEPTMN